MASISELQEDLLIEILLRLPVKTLIRITCVCKYWLSLIRSPDFAAKHHSLRSKFEPDSVLALFQDGCSISLFDYQNLTFQTAFKFRPAVSYDPLRFKIYHRDIITDCWITGPCNGLFLIRLFKVGALVLLLWNPATREIFNIPYANDVACAYFGFGYDSVTNDYKVVGLYVMGVDLTRDCSVVWLYSLAANSWRRIFDDALYERNMMVSGLVSSSSNGRMHNWEWEHLHNERRSCLLSFDMVDEVFVETPLPCDAPYVHGFLNQGSNHMYPTVYYTSQDFELHVWVLEGYGATGVWNKHPSVRVPGFYPTSVMVMWKGKEIVHQHQRTIHSFNLTTKEIKSLQFPADESIIAYTESLVSIAKYVRQPPTIDQTSVEISVLQQLSFQLREERPVHDQEDLSLTTMDHQMLPKEEQEEDDSDNSSTDSAFLTPDITAYREYNTVYIDHETDSKFRCHRRNEVDRLSKLPYCLQEVNKPMMSNPVTF